jgi:hypothetical protein
MQTDDPIKSAIWQSRIVGAPQPARRSEKKPAAAKILPGPQGHDANLMKLFGVAGNAEDQP